MEEIINNPLVACVISLSVLVIALMFIAINLYVKIANIKVEINNLTDANQDRIKDLSGVRNDISHIDSRYKGLFELVGGINIYLSRALYSRGEIIESKNHKQKLIIYDIHESKTEFGVIEPTYLCLPLKTKYDEDKVICVHQSQITAHY